MKIRVTPIEPGLCSVHLSPSWIEWLLGRREHDDLVSGWGEQWSWESTGKAVTGRVMDAVRQAVYDGQRARLETETR